MRLSVFLLIIALALSLACLGQSALAQNQTNPQEKTINPPDTTKTKTATKSKTTKTKAEEKTVKDTTKSTYISPDKGLGPIKEIKLGPIDTSMVSQGEQIFKSQCFTCHLLDKKKIGPPLRTATTDRPPEFVMNMILNTDEMEKKDPEVKKLISQYGVYMSVLDISKDQARQILEYLRWAAKQPPDNQ
jgi:cytochrome c